MKKQSNTLFLAQSAMIAAIYVVLTVILAPFSYGEVQVRVSEALTILPVFTPTLTKTPPFPSGSVMNCQTGRLSGLRPTSIFWIVSPRSSRIRLLFPALA